MKKPNYSFCVLMVFVFLSTNILGQDKYENEIRLNKDQIPTIALAFINDLNINSKVKWYKEFGLNKESIEAKFKYKGKSYSLEFDTTGVIQDLEIDTKIKHLAPSPQKKINEKLNLICSKHKIYKTQIQYIGSKKDLSLLILGTENKETLVVKYEIEAKCKIKAATDKFEYLFSEQGVLEESHKIILKNSSNLEY